jgi:hypothetical protein
MKRQTTNCKPQNIFGIWFLKTGICLGFCCLLLGFTTGCAKTVTNVNFGTTMVVTVTLRGNADILNNRYFMVLAPNPTFKTPLPLAENPNHFEFLEPDGTQPKDTSQSLAAYYTNFFSNWAGYIMLDSTGQYQLVPGPFVQSNPTVNRITFATFSGGSNKLSFNFQLNQIFTTGSGVPATAYFDVIAVPWPAGGAKIAEDHLNSTNAYISTLSGSTLTINDIDLSPPANASLDIQTVEVSVQ